jgi:hypothetical protein
MKTISMIGCAAAIVVGMAAPATAATTDPEVIIYRVPGVRDDGGGGFVGVGTVFHCTNFSGATENIRFVTRNWNNALLSNVLVDNIQHLTTFTVATKAVFAYVALPVFNTGVVNQGTTAIAATSRNIVCTAMTIDAANGKPTFAVSLRGIRFNPAPGSQE